MLTRQQPELEHISIMYFYDRYPTTNYLQYQNICSKTVEIIIIITSISNKLLGLLTKYKVLLYIIYLMKHKKCCCVYLLLHFIVTGDWFYGEAKACYM